MTRPKVCHPAVGHRKGCRPARPCCAVMRKVRPDRRACVCALVPFPHRRGYCQSGSASAMAWAEESEEAFRERQASAEAEAFHFFDQLTQDSAA